MPNKALLPHEVPEGLGPFDRFATATSDFVSRAPFFAACVLLVLVWAPSIVAIKEIDTWQLIINTITTIITFLLVALLQNTQARADAATQHKLNAIADALSDYLGSVEGMAQHARELRDAVGLERRESSGKA